MCVDKRLKTKVPDQLPSVHGTGEHSILFFYFRKQNTLGLSLVTMSLCCLEHHVGLAKDQNYNNKQLRITTLISHSSLEMNFIWGTLGKSIWFLTHALWYSLKKSQSSQLAAENDASLPMAKNTKVVLATKIQNYFFYWSFCLVSNQFVWVSRFSFKGGDSNRFTVICSRLNRTKIRCLLLEDKTV